MEIDFNPGRVPDANTAQPVSRRPASTSTPADSAPAGAQTLERKLQEIPLVRPEKVEGAKLKTSDLKFPPDDLLDSIANLLASHLK